MDYFLKEEESQLDKIRVAIADDNDVFLRELGSRIHADQNMNLVGTARNGEEMCNLIREESPDVVTLDLIMPRKDGLGVMDTILREEGLKKKPSFIVVSAVGKDKIIQEAFELGADYYLRKPVELSCIVSKIRSSFFMQPQGQKLRLPSMLREEPAAYVSGNLAGDISSLLVELGIPPHIKGYHYLREAVMEALEHPEYLNSVTRQLYPVVAEKYKSTAGKVERGIRHAIEVAWERGRMDMIDQIFGYSTSLRSDRPTNCEFIALLTDKLSLEYKNGLSKK